MYAKAIVDYIDPEKRYIDYVLSRNHCIMTGEHVVKDLRVLSHRKLENIVIVDNSVVSFAGQLDNGIYIPTYTGDTDDKELVTIAEFLKAIVETRDVRPYVSEFAGIKDLLAEFKKK